MSSIETEPLGHDPKKECNLTGSLTTKEVQIWETVLVCAGADSGLWHPDDRKTYDPANPLAGLCDVASALLAMVYADPESGDHVQWIRVQKKGASGWKVGDYDVHYDVVSSAFGELDFTRSQFEAGRVFNVVGKKVIQKKSKKVDFRSSQLSERLPPIRQTLVSIAREEIAKNPTYPWTHELIAFVQKD